ncbi:MAG: hypothetical protein ABI645_04135 [Pseudomonadota bacterium]
MTMSPKVRANIATIVAYAPFIVANTLYRGQLSQRTWVYLGLLSMLPAILIYQWVYHRETLKHPAPALPRAELNLAPERLPPVVWLAIMPPLIAAAFLWWITTYSIELPWRDSWLGPPKPAASHEMFRMLGVMFVIWNCLGSWRVGLGLAQWHGMPRAYVSRRKRLLLAIEAQWLFLLIPLAHTCGNLFRLPTLWATVCGVVVGVGVLAIIWSANRERQLRKAEPRIGTWCYFDFRDPAFLGPRGLNLASGWSWTLAAIALSPIVLAEWLLHQGRV